MEYSSEVLATSQHFRSFTQLAFFFFKSGLVEDKTQTITVSIFVY